MIDGNSALIAHIGYPTTTFKASMIYNPYFAHIGVNAAVVPMGVRAEDFASALKTIFRFTNIRGALITMPHKVTTLQLVDEASPAARIAGACNAVRLIGDGKLLGDMFDGEGFVRGLQRKGCTIKEARALVVGSGGVGSAIAASLAAAGLAHLSLDDINDGVTNALAARLRHHYPLLRIEPGRRDPRGHDIIINATPLGMNADDPMPLDVDLLPPQSFVGEVVMKAEKTAFLLAAEARGCRTQAGIDMLYEQIPAYLEFFGFPTTTPEMLRAYAQVSY